ncbi:MAG: BACON domain-containing protein [Tannerella sp.]|jgi:hypothetical protein|nr:BACON domain-containing protein [Tannerella sp.]
MKTFGFNFLTLAAAVSGTLLLTACRPNPDEDRPDSLTLSKTQFTFDADDTERQSVNITTTAASWSFRATADWISTSGSGNTLYISVKSHTDSQSPRNATIVVEAGNAEPAQISVTQNARHSLSINPESLEYESDKTGDKTVAVTTNAASWDATTDAAWISLSRQDNTLRVTVSTENAETSERTATVRITAGSAAEKTLTVTQAGRKATTYNTAECRYLGDALEKGTAVFLLDLYDASNPNVGVFIQGHCALPSRFADFRITSGTYILGAGSAFATQGTFASGSKTDNGIAGTGVYNFNTQDFIFIDNGTFTVESSGNSYTVTTNFSGIDYRTGARVNNLYYRYEGPIRYINESDELSFEDIPNRAYSATGTPSASIDIPGPRTWSGRITPNAAEQYYGISNWANEDIGVRCNFRDGAIILDRETKVAGTSDNTVDGYFCACTINGDIITIYGSNYEHAVSYDRSSRTLDFSGTKDGRTVLVGVVGFYRSTGESVGVFTDLYANARLVLSSTSSGAPQFSGSAVVKAADINAGGYKIRKADAPAATGSSGGGKKYTIGRESLKKLTAK